MSSYIVNWKQKGISFINKEYCSSIEEAMRWKKAHVSKGCEFCHIEIKE